MGFEHAHRGYDCLVTTWKCTRITIESFAVAVVVWNILLKRRHRAAKRLELANERGELGEGTASIFEKAGYGAYDVSYVRELLQSDTRKDNLDKREILK